MCHDFHQATDVCVHINAVSQLFGVKGPNVYRDISARSKNVNESHLKHLLFT